MPVLVAETLREDLNQKNSSFPLAGEQGARQGQAAVLLPAIPVPARRADALAANGKKVRRCDRAQVGIPRDLLRPVAGAFREISFGQCLQPPGNPPEQMFPVPRSRFFLKHLPILFSQTSQPRPAQVLDFHQYRAVHSLGSSPWPSTTVT
jgi:hypothetical protein